MRLIAFLESTRADENRIETGITFDNNFSESMFKVIWKISLGATLVNNFTARRKICFYRHGGKIPLELFLHTFIVKRD